jgi:hypothetical protein
MPLLGGHRSCCLSDGDSEVIGGKTCVPLKLWPDIGLDGVFFVGDKPEADGGIGDTGTGEANWWVGCRGDVDWGA